MNLFLVQHGLAKTEIEDPTRALNSAGIKSTEKVAKWLAAAIIEVDEIRHSGKKRAEQTAMIFAGHLSPKQGIAAASGLNPKDDVEPIANEIKEQQGSLMLVGHLPFMSRLIGLLVAGDPDSELVRFQNSGVVCLRKNADRWGIEWMVVPDLLRD